MKAFVMRKSSSSISASVLTWELQKNFNISEMKFETICSKITLFKLGPSFMNFCVLQRFYQKERPLYFSSLKNSYKYFTLSIEVMSDLISVGCDILTIGQYLQPSSSHLPVREFVHPKQYQIYEQKGLELGFKYVVAGPLVRSSYKAGAYQP
ncbi:hypothetical protein HMPREF1705_04566 [Acetomicrobium hydrogeniformans ATCC BAA-1850]|uniref:Lipoyl synthase n=1 Tax=Acetomicrobium hydrogeniformans ATCC BAA-1850 TaxID=592015 RepID=A0A0T5X830_9BACT|nr:hypothetical protein HMPREF1705_04566 [Acetomicrobium hydrogeniformans ATCC BAA-1850]